jgi:hypothetical protein
MRRELAETLHTVLSGWRAALNPANHRSDGAL